MIFSNKTRIEEYIIEILDNGALDGPSLFNMVVEQHGSTTKQSVYKALRKLMLDEVLNKQRTHYSLNRYWLQKIRDFTDRHIEKAESVDINNVLEFEDGDSVVYAFKNPFLLDITWGHFYDILYEVNSEEQVMLNYHPHEWLIHSRPETERFWLNRFQEDNKMMCFAIGCSTSLDRNFQKEYSSDHVKINLGETYGLKPNQYLAVLGDYVFEITTDRDFEDKVHTFFKKTESIGNLDQEQITEISKLKYRSRLKLSKNKRKADKWRTKFKQDFYIPKPYYLFKPDTEVV
jgi:hypothetical protein